MTSSHAATVQEFMGCAPDAMVGVLSLAIAAKGIARQHSTQIRVWNREVVVLSPALAETISSAGDATKRMIALEYGIPHRQERADAVTSARSGMIIWVPPGSADDPTRNPHWLDGSYSHLRAAGVPDLGMEGEAVQ